MAETLRKVTLNYTSGKTVTLRGEALQSYLNQIAAGAMAVQRLNRLSEQETVRDDDAPKSLREALEHLKDHKKDN